MKSTCVTLTKCYYFLSYLHDYHNNTEILKKNLRNPTVKIKMTNHLRYSD